MSLHEAERRRDRRSSSSDDDRSDGETDRRLGVTLVVALALISGLADLVGGLALVASPLFLIGVPVAAIGAVKCWAALGLRRRSPRALGLTFLFFGVGAMVSTGELLFALRGGGGLVAPAAALALDLAVVGYLFVLVDEFD